MRYQVDYLANYPAFVESVARLKRDQWRHTAPNRPWDVWLGEILESAQIAGFPCTFVAVVDSELAGFVTLVRIGDKASVRNGLWLITLYVKSAHRRHGIGAALIDRCIAEARATGHNALYLWTESKDLTAYYGRRGWQLIGTDSVDGDDTMVYQIS